MEDARFTERRGGLPTALLLTFQMQASSFAPWRAKLSSYMKGF